MTEDEAQAWLRSVLHVSRETMEKLIEFRRLLLAENAHQNLISQESQDHIWARHIVDSAQLLTVDRMRPRSWLDLGTGAGFPGMVIAILRNYPITFVESRSRRVAFLKATAAALELDHITVQHSRLEVLETATFGVISARAFAPLAKMLKIAHRFAHNYTVWLIPKGRSAQTELESIRGSWHGAFHVKHSVTDPEAGIIVATGVRPLGTK